VAGLVLLVSLPGCSRAAPEQLVVFAAASLTETFSEVADSLRARHAGLDVRLNFAASSILALQLSQGAAADVFASADLQWMRAMQDSGIADSAVTFASNVLTLIVPSGNPGHVGALSDLARKGVKLVLAGDAVPAGRYARAVIGKLADAPGFPRGYERAVLANVVSNEETVRGVLTKVALGEADAGIVYVSDISASDGTRVRAIDIPADRNVVALYPVAVVRKAANAAGARELIALLLSPAGQRILARHGFRPPPA
jgi:molybdate transport system substrate-binding protein